MPALIPIGIVIFIIWYVIPRLGGLFTPAAPPPPPAPTVVVVESGGSDVFALLTGALSVIVIGIAALFIIVATALLTLWLSRRSQQRQERRIAETAAIYARTRASRTTLPGAAGARNVGHPRSAIRYE